MRKARIWRAFLIKKRKFSENSNAWLEREDSNSRIPDRTRSLPEFYQIWEYQVRGHAPGAFYATKTTR
jgi:hypothetical protein